MFIVYSELEKYLNLMYLIDSTHLFHRLFTTILIPQGNSASYRHGRGHHHASQSIFTFRIGSITCGGFTRSKAEEGSHLLLWNRRRTNLAYNSVYKLLCCGCICSWVSFKPWG